MDTERAQATIGLDQLEDVLVDGLPDLLDELEKLLRDVSDDYATFVTDSRDVVLGAAQGAVRSLLAIADSILAGGERATEWGPDADWGLFEEIGRIQWRQGTPVGTLLSAYQLGARVAWRQMSQRALSHGLRPNALAALAEAVFCFVDQLSSASAAGYLSEQSEAAAARERSRDELVDLLLSDRSDTSSVRAAALRAGWPVPGTAAVLFVEANNEVGRDIVSRLDQSCLLVRRPGLLGAIVPDPAAPGRRQRLAKALRGSSAVVGHTVALDHLPASAQIAELATRLQQAGVLAEDPVFVDEHIDAIIVHRDQRLLDALCRQVLQPLEGASPAFREPLRQTLRSWLRTMGDRRAIAEELHVHPQTVRYRMGRLRSLFGAALDDPAVRLQLTLALAWDPGSPGRSSPLDQTD
jgi:PucR C-terminal helix-turn-helix domain